MKRGFVKDKTGQFYLVAAIIISVIVVSFVTLSNYAEGQELANVQNVGDELKIESEKVLDFGTYNSYSETQINDLMGKFVNDSINYNNNGEDFYFIFGDISGITFTGYSQTDSAISINISGEEIPINLAEREILFQKFIPESENTIILTIDSTNYEFELKDGKNFYFVVSQEIGGEKYVARN